MRDVKMIKYINDLIPSFLNIVKDKNKWQGPALGAPSYIYCTVLYCTVQNCTVLYCTELYCTVMYCTVPYCTVLYCKKLENLPRTSTQTHRQTNREFNYRGHSYPLWIVGGSGPITARTAVALYCRKKLENLLRTKSTL